jgi:CRP/FNR family transcriptional regulator, cyclic AMP receptor protein
MGLKETVAHLKRVPLFENCTGRQLRDIAGRGRERSYPEGRILVEEGKHGDEFSVILEGEVIVRRNGRRIATLRAGDHFGELALLQALVSRRPRRATVTTATPVRCFTLSVSQFKTVIYEGDIAVKLLYSVAEMFPED